MKHKHAEVIKAWADGAIIEVFLKVRWFVVYNPQWNEDYQYRIKPEPKPEPKPDYKKYFVYNKYHKTFYDTGDNCYPNGLVATFDGETGKLKRAEVLG